MSDHPDPDAFGCYIPPAVWSDDNLSLTLKAYFGRLLPLITGQEEGCTASNAYLEKCLGTSGRAIRAALERLEDLDYIERQTVPTKDGKYRRIILGEKATGRILPHPRKKASAPPEESFHQSSRGSSRERNQGRTRPKENGNGRKPHVRGRPIDSTFWRTEGGKQLKRELQEAGEWPDE